MKFSTPQLATWAAAGTRLTGGAECQRGNGE